ncbi:hypothetical protein [Amycolatopsis sp. RTGN1]|uniref:hypothetical protein n=1 Tax=Amycolatopsis ponsaeliensis TaxID=2992142 RepID=UPI00254F59F9|nr:hypothetical protein [Amycolatopsis sp. RTGN1]
MNTLLVGYDLNRPGQNYADLITFLKSQKSWCHPLDSTWLVTTSQNTAQFRDEVKRFIDSNDEALVVNVGGDAWASFNLSTTVNDWLKAHV